MSKVIRDWLVFTLLCYVIGLGNSRYFLNQSDSPLKPIASFACSYFKFSLAPRDISFAMIGCCDCQSFGFTTLNQKTLQGLQLREDRLLQRTRWGVLWFMFTKRPAHFLHQQCRKHSDCKYIIHHSFIHSFNLSFSLAFLYFAICCCTHSFNDILIE